MKQFYFLCALVFFNTILYAQTSAVCFNGPTSNTLAVTHDAEAICTGDFNDDGKIDIATANTHSDNMSVFLGDGMGNFSTAISFSIGIGTGTGNGTGYNFGPVSITSTDVNNDHKMDIVTANYFNNDVSILLGDGIGNFSVAADYTVGTNPRTVISADFNADGNIDLATANSGSNSMSVLLGSGTGSFAAATNFTVGTQPFSLANADFNGDLKTDLAVINSGSNNVSILLGNGNGTFATAVNYTVDVNNGWPDIICADVNADGKLDLLNNYSASTNEIFVLLGNGNGTFYTGTSALTDIQPEYVIAKDFNKDGKIDLASANNGNNGSYPPDISILTGNGTGNFSAPLNFPFLNLNFYRVTMVSDDFNGDSLPDIAVNGGNAITILLNKTAFITASGPTTFCAGQHVILKSNQNNVSYNWQPGGLTSDSIVVNSSGVYSCSVTVADNSCVSSNGKSVTVNALPAVSILSNTPCATQQALNFGSLVAPTGTYTYTWSGPNSFTSTAQNPSVATASVTTNLTGTYTLSVMDVNNCANTATVNVVVNTLPTITASGATVCVGQTIQLTASGGVSYSWSSGIYISSSQNPVISNATPTNGGIYIVTVVDANGCISTSSAQVVINFLPTITAVASPSVICMGNTSTLTASGGATYTWTGSDLNSSTGSTVFGNPASTINYIVTGTDANGCIGTSSVQVVVNTCTGINEIKTNKAQIEVYPNPNNGLFNLQVTEHENMRVEVYDVIGQKVYAETLQNNLQSLNISSLTDGVYFVRVLKNNQVVYQTKICKQ